MFFFKQFSSIVRISVCVIREAFPRIFDLLYSSSIGDIGLYSRMLIKNTVISVNQ